MHYTANVLGKDGEWNNKAFTDFVLSKGCTALPGAVEFAEHCVSHGVALFYVTNRYDQGYKVSEEGYAGQAGYKKTDGTVIGSSTFDLFGKQNCLIILIIRMGKVKHGNFMTKGSFIPEMIPFAGE